MSESSYHGATSRSQMGAIHTFIARTFGFFPCCCKQLDATLNADRADIRKVELRQTQTDNTPPPPPHEDWYLCVLHLRNRILTVSSSATNALGHRVSRQTVCRKLRAHGIRTYRPHRGNLLTAQWRNYGEGVWDGFNPPPPPFKPWAPHRLPHLTFDCAPFIAMPSSWPLKMRIWPLLTPLPPLSYATVTAQNRLVRLRWASTVRRWQPRDQ